MIKEIVESLYYFFTGHTNEADASTNYDEKVRGVLSWSGIILFCITMLFLFGR